MLLTACSPPPQTVAADRRDCISAAPAHSGAHRWAPAAAQPAGYLRRTGRDIRLALHHRPDHDLELGGSLGPGLGLRRVRAPGGAGLGWAEAGCAPTPAQGKGSAPLPHANGLRDRRCAGGRQRDAVRLPALRHRRRIPAAAGGRSPEESKRAWRLLAWTLQSQPCVWIFTISTRVMAFERLDAL